MINRNVFFCCVIPTRTIYRIFSCKFALGIKVYWFEVVIDNRNVEEQWLQKEPYFMF